MNRNIVVPSLIALGCSLALATFAQAQAAEDHSKMDRSKMDHSKMDHSKMDHSKMDHSKMDHSKMDHSNMDHSKMDRSKMDRSKMDRSKMDHSNMDHSNMDHSKMDHSKMDHSKMDHSKMDHSKMDHSKMDPSKMDHSKMDHSKMDHSKMDHSKMDHSKMAKMDHSKMDHSDDVPLEPIPEVSDADRAAAFPHLVPHHMADNAVHSYLQLSRLETWKADAGGALAWQGSGWIGTDLNRVWLRSEGERIDGRTGHAELEVLYGRSVAPWWDVVVGVRQDFRPGPSQTWAGFGVQGLAPYKFEVQATAYVGESGQTAARFEIDYETLITNRLILQPFIEANFFGQNDARRGVGSGLSTVEGGMRLRYEFHRQLAPYLGVVHERAFGGTADFRRGAGEGTNDSRVVVGLRTWF